MEKEEKVEGDDEQAAEQVDLEPEQLDSYLG
jgi:hypothetical protein